EQTYVFIDIPGIGDTKGVQHDNENLAHIFDTILESRDVTAILLLLNGAQGRHITTVKNVLTRIEDRLPNNILSNVIIILTNCRSHSVNFDPEKVGLSTKATVLYMQNSAFSSHPNTWNAEIVSALQRDWDASTSDIKNLICHIRSLLSVPMSTLYDIQQDRHRIKSRIKSTEIRPT
ncbi:unnamed protein product, partial [Didymodactylos carnosus]